MRVLGFYLFPTERAKTGWLVSAFTLKVAVRGDPMRAQTTPRFADHVELKLKTHINIQIARDNVFSVRLWHSVQKQRGYRSQFD